MYLRVIFVRILHDLLQVVAKCLLGLGIIVDTQGLASSDGKANENKNLKRIDYAKTLNYLGFYLRCSWLLVMRKTDAKQKHKALFIPAEAHHLLLGESCACFERALGKKR